MPARRRIKAVTRKLRELGSIGSAVLSTGHPYMAHIVPMRRCNLACTYCNEFDDFSDPVPVDEMLRRIDHLGRLGTSVITISGGEPLLHPQIVEIVTASGCLRDNMVKRCAVIRIARQREIHRPLADPTQQPVALDDATETNDACRSLGFTPRTPTGAPKSARRDYLTAAVALATACRDQRQGFEPPGSAPRRQSEP